jgi:hypothetical protein
MREIDSAFALNVNGKTHAETPRRGEDVAVAILFSK